MRGGRGWGKGDYKTLIPLCTEHHRGNTGVHGLGTKGFEKHYGFTEEDLLNDAITLASAISQRSLLVLLGQTRSVSSCQSSHAQSCHPYSYRW